jgi:hypothetical protein
LAGARALTDQLEGALLQADRANPTLSAVITILERIVRDDAARWWSSPALSLDGHVPPAIALEGDLGRQRVATFILQIEYGVFA